MIRWDQNMWLSEQKPDMFTYKLKFILLPQLIATLNNYSCSLPPLVIVNWSAFPKCSKLTMYIHDWWNGANGWLQFGSGDLKWLPLSVNICLGIVVEYWPFVGTCGPHSPSYYNSTVCLLLLLCFSLCYHLHQYLCPSHPSLTHADPILMNSMKNCQNWWKSSII